MPITRSPSRPSREEEQSAYVAAMDALQRSTNLQNLLRYVCSKYFEGKAEDVKEYCIAVDALGRSPDFDPKTNALVRVEAHRLRKRLRQFYETEGSARHVRLYLPEGSYVPEFRYSDTARPAAEGSGRVAWRLVAGISGAVAAALVLVFVMTLHKPAPVAASPLKTPPVTPATAAGEIRILCGRGSGLYQDRFGHSWEGDRFFHGGSAVAVRPGVIVKGYDPNVFAGMREGDFTYDIPVNQGNYDLHLLFAETEYGEENPLGGGQESRLINVQLNGAVVISGLDVFSDAGQANTADVKIFSGVHPSQDGAIHIGINAAGLGAGMLSGIEVVPHSNAFRIIAQTAPFRDRKGQLWEPDHFVTGGALIQRPGPPGTVTVGEAEIYRGERWGRFTYAIPAAPGAYTVNLYFAETWFGGGMPGGGGEDSRAFDVYNRHHSLLTNFSILQAAGAPSRTIEKSFPHIEPDSRGKIVLSFEPIRNWACVNAIELIQE